MIKKKKIEILNVIKLIFYLFTLLLLSSKSILIFTSITLLILIIYNLKYYKLKIYSFFFVLLVVLTLVLKVGFIKNRFSEVLNINSLSELKEERMTDFKKVNGLTLRLMFVKFSIQDFIESPKNILFGVGVGDRKEFLNSVYENHNMARKIKEKSLGYYNYNTHNQYVEIFLGLGTVGLLYFIWMFFYCVKRTKEEFIAKYIYGLLIWSFFFEAVLNRNKGIVFFVFWTTVFLCIEYSSEKNNSIILD
ncbi:O-antigen ligase family protein [Flavivirga aquatica]|nr:O-antigen ligase family protein [Flavivirga aquatica]